MNSHICSPFFSNGELISKTLYRSATYIYQLCILYDLRRPIRSTQSYCSSPLSGRSRETATGSGEQRFCTQDVILNDARTVFVASKPQEESYDDRLFQPLPLN